MSALVEIDALRVATDGGTELVHGVTVTVPRGGSVGIVGESGSGKTLTCRALLGILDRGLHVTEGSIRFDGVELAHATDKERRALWGQRIGAVFQDPASYLNPSIRVGTQLEESLRVVGGLSRSAAKRRTIELFAAVGLREPERVARQYVFELSGGMLQRVLIAIAVSNNPELLIADEATTALDVVVQADVLDLLSRLRAELGLTLVVVSHDLAVIAQMCDYIYVFKDGVIVEEGVTADVLAHQQHEYTSSLVDSHLTYGLNRLGAGAVA